jgi:pyruvate dehydrogenase E1 component alpha subunit
VTKKSEPVPTQTYEEPHSDAAEHDAIYAKEAINAQLPAERKIELYTQMVRIRFFEDRSLRVYQQGKIGGFLHLYNGQEAVAVGTCSLLGPDDHVITAYRDHGHALAVGMSMNECMAELMGKATGCSKGKGGSMHFFAPDKRFWGGHGIVGGQTPLGLGIAYALKYQGKKGACLTFLGDGAVNQGAFHEALNMASLWDVPVVFIIENNQYSMGTSQARSSAGEPLAKRAEAYAMDWAIVNGNSLYEVRARTHEALERAHRQNRPSLLEMRTYRYRGHSVADANAEKYRTKAEIESYKRDRDPITLFRVALFHEGILDDAKVEAIHEQAKEEVETSVRFADESPFADPTEIFTDVYATIDENPAAQHGTHFFNADAHWCGPRPLGSARA